MIKKLRAALFAAVIFVLLIGVAYAAQTGLLKLDILGDIGAGAENAAQVIAPDGKVAGEVRPGATIALAPGVYKLVIHAVGATITKNNVIVEAGRTHTVLITNLAVLQVAVTDRDGKDPGFGVTVTSTDPPHSQVASFLSGEKYLFAPQMVDVHVDAPPQGYDWHAVVLKPGERARLTLGEIVPADLTVQTTLQKLPIDNSTRVIIMRAGTQSRVAESAPGPSHHFTLNPGDYDAYIENDSGKGKPTAMATGIHLGSGAKVEKTVPLD